jgi:hypothetical protein
MMRLNWLLNAKNVENYFYSGSSETSPVSVLSDTVFTVAECTPIVTGKQQSLGLEPVGCGTVFLQMSRSGDLDPVRK